MTARVLVVDDIVANVKLLEAKLRAEYFEVYTAMNGKEAIEIVNKERPDIILLDAEAINVAPLNNAPGAVVTLMDRTNVDTVMVAGKIRKWQGSLLGHDMTKLRRELESSRDYIFEKAGVAQDLFA